MRSAGVLFVGREDGVLEVWDLLDRSHEPVLIATPSAAAITSLAFSPASTSPGSSARPVRQLLAIGANAHNDMECTAGAPALGPKVFDIQCLGMPASPHGDAFASDASDYLDAEAPPRQQRPHMQPGRLRCMMHELFR